MSKYYLTIYSTPVAYISTFKFQESWIDVDMVLILCHEHLAEKWTQNTPFIARLCSVDLHPFAYHGFSVFHRLPFGNSTHWTRLAIGIFYYIMNGSVSVSIVKYDVMISGHANIMFVIRHSLLIRGWLSLMFALLLWMVRTQCIILDKIKICK